MTTVKQTPAAYTRDGNEPLTYYLHDYIPRYHWGYHLRIPSQMLNVTIAHAGDFWDILRLVNVDNNLNTAHFQLERGAQNTTHWQCTFFLKHRKKLRDLRQLLGLPKNDKLYYLKFVDNPKQSVNYCRKLETRVAGPYYVCLEQTHNLPFNP